MLDTVIDNPHFDLNGLWRFPPVTETIVGIQITQESRDSDPKESSGIRVEFQVGKKLFVPFWLGYISPRENTSRVYNFSAARFVICDPKDSTYEDEFRADPNNVVVTGAIKAFVQEHMKLVPYKPNIGPGKNPKESASLELYTHAPR